MNDTVLTVLGNVGSDIRQVVTGNGALLTSFRLASTPRSLDRSTGEWVDGTTTWYSVVAWRNLADNIAASLGKGDPVMVHGRLRTVAWERDGRTGESLEIDAVSVGPDLTRGRAVYRKVVRATDRSGRGDTAGPGPGGHGRHDGERNDGERHDGEHTDGANAGGEHPEEPRGDRDDAGAGVGGGSGGGSDDAEARELVGADRAR